MKCDECDQPARFTVHAAYDSASGDVHPRMNRYPGAMARLCDAHLVGFLDRDSDAPYSTQRWVLSRLARL